MSAENHTSEVQDQPIANDSEVKPGLDMHRVYFGLACAVPMAIVIFDKVTSPANKDIPESCLRNVFNLAAVTGLTTLGIKEVSNWRHSVINTAENTHE